MSSPRRCSTREESLVASAAPRRTLASSDALAALPWTDPFVPPGSAGAQRAEPEWQDWQSDVTDSMGIGPSLTGYRRVGLRCGADHMAVEVEMEDDFDGVLYARGAFYSQEEPCFLDAHGGRNFSLRLPFDKCNTRDVSLRFRWPRPRGCGLQYEA